VECSNPLLSSSPANGRKPAGALLEHGGPCDCSLRRVASHKPVTFLGAFHRCLLSKAKGARYCCTCCNIAKFTVSCHVMSSVPIFCHLKGSIVPGSEKLSMDSEGMLIDYHTLFDALNLMTAGGWGCCRIRDTERSSLGFGLPTAAIKLYRG